MNASLLEILRQRAPGLDLTTPVAQQWLAVVSALQGEWAREHEALQPRPPAALGEGAAGDGYSTAWRQTEARLRDREMLLSSINANLTSTIIYRAEHRPDGSISCSYVSPGTQVFVGLTAEELYRDPKRMFAQIHRDDLPAFLAELARVLRSGEVSDIVVRMQHVNDGTWRWMQFRSHLSERRSDGVQVRDGIVTDITALKHTEAELQRVNGNLEQIVRERTAEVAASEARYRFLFEQAPDAILVHDVDQRRIIDYNRNLLRLFECTDEDMRHHNWGQFTPDFQPGGRPSMDAAADLMERALAGETVNYEWTLRTKKGRKIRCAVQLALLPAPDRRLLRASVIDITAREEAEAARRVNEEKFRGVFDHSPVIICLLTVPDGRIVDVNPAAESAFGFKREDAIGRTSTELNVWADPQERQEYLQRLVSTGSVKAMEARMRRLDNGRIFTALYSGTLITIGGRPYSLNILQDISARKESERIRDHLLALTQATLESTADGILVMDASNRIVTYNRLFATMWRLPEQNLSRHDRYWILRTAASQLAEPERLLGRIRLLADDPLAENFETLHFKDGRVFEHFSRPQLINGTATGRVWSFRDVTERFHAERERAKLEATLRQTQKIESLGTLAGGIAHDFNNILTGIFGFLELARQELPRHHPAGEWLEQARVTSQRAKELVSQILTFSRRTEGKRTPQPLGPIVAEALRLLRSTLPAGVGLSSHVDPSCSEVAADATQIHQVITNLCTNAWHALPARGGQITVTLQMHAPPEDLLATHRGLAERPTVRLSIVDNGSGMTAATQQRIFEPFFTTKETGRGTGLGLAVVHGIVEAHGGAITFESVLERGTRFDVFFPTVAATRAPSATKPVAIVRGRGQAVLFVDDDAASNAAINHTLTSLGYHVTACRDPQQALDRFRQNPAAFALVITDFSMPGMNGGEVATQVLALRPSIPVIVVSGYLDPKDQLHLSQAGVRAILGKPPSRDELSQTLAMSLSAQR